jgi:DNA invertase Pin-like site-specific DNA recombinase
MSPKTKNQKLLGYVRVSRMKEDGISPDLQRAAIEAYAIAHGHDIIWLDPDLDESGKSLDRPSIQDALARLARGEADGIVAAKLDRLTRSVGDLGKLLALAKEEDWNLVAIDLGVDLTTPNGKLVAQLLGSIAEWELDRRREGWREARTSARERGVYLSSRTPAGYTRDPKTKVLQPNAFAPFIVQAFEARADGATWREVAAILTDAGVPREAPAGEKSENGRRKLALVTTPWTAQAVAQTLENRAFLGEGGDHEAIVSPGLFARVEARKVEKDSFADPSRYRDLLAGVVRCGCGSSMTRNRKLKGGDYEWRCSARCANATTVNYNNLEKLVLGFIRDHADEVSVEIPRSNDAAVKAAQIALDNAQAEIAAFLANVPATTPGYGDAVAQRQVAVDDAATALNNTVAGTGAGDWVVDYTETPDNEVAIIVQVDTSGGSVKGQALVWHLLNVNQLDNARARRMVRQVVASVTVTKANGTHAPLEERVEVKLV